MYNHNKAQQSKNRVHISWDILYIYIWINPFTLSAYTPCKCCHIDFRIILLSLIKLTVVLLLFCWLLIPKKMVGSAINNSSLLGYIIDMRKWKTVDTLTILSPQYWLTVRQFRYVRSTNYTLNATTICKNTFLHIGSGDRGCRVGCKYRTNEFSNRLYRFIQRCLECHICSYLDFTHGPLTRDVKLWTEHAPGMPGTFSSAPTSKEFAN